MKKVRKKKRKLTLPFSMIQEKIGMWTKIEMEIIMVENVECSSFFYTTSLTFLSFYSILFYSILVHFFSPPFQTFLLDSYIKN